MDNGIISSNDAKRLIWAYQKLKIIFQEYCFPLQKFVTNDERLREIIEMETGETSDTIVKILGIHWNTSTDQLTVPKFKLDSIATTKGQILSSIAKNYDVCQINGPLLNRARLFMQRLQLESGLGWDEILADGYLREWRNIAKQLNNAKCSPFLGLLEP